MCHICQKGRFQLIGILCLLLCIYQSLLIFYIFLIIDHTSHNKINLTVIIILQSLPYYLIAPIFALIVFQTEINGKLRQLFIPYLIE